MFNRKLLVSIILLFTHPVFADGVMLPSAPDYPKDFLQHRLTRVTVTINEPVAETSVYQEFVNEWTDSTDVVYSFPLPPEARATNVIYWSEDIAYQAVLKVKEQAVNPGTGEGGVAALVNKYIGRNGIKIQLLKVPPGEIQRVRLDYISLCEYYQGEYIYEYPLNTADFVTYPLEHLEFNFTVNSNTEIMGFDLPGFSDYFALQYETNSLEVSLIEPKAYINRDLRFIYETQRSELGVDFYSVANDSTPGHFALSVQPPGIETFAAIPKRIFFLLSNSSSMTGYKLSQSIAAISDAISKLTTEDQLNIMVYNFNVSSWQTAPVQATPQNKLSAQNFLTGINSQSGSRLDIGLDKCLNQIVDSDLSNAILAFTDGRSPLDPIQIESDNIHMAGIFPVAIGDNLDRARLEMTAALNYGFVTYLDENDNLFEEMNRIFEKISKPILTEVKMEYGTATLSQILPEKIPATYAETYFMTTGRYANSGISGLSIGGNSVVGAQAFDFLLDFSSKTDSNKFAAFIWAKEMIDDIERRIEVYGETEDLKQQLIHLSLTYNIRCRYTAYIADYENVCTDCATSVSEKNRETSLVPEQSFLAGNYPNPFNPTTKIRFFIAGSNAGAAKLIKIYNSLGQLVAVIDVSYLASGWHEVEFNGRDFKGNILPSGIYFVQLQIHNRASNVISMQLVK